MDDERPEWAVRLQDEREIRGWSKWETARRLYRAAGIEGGNVRSLARQISWWEAGQHFPETWAAAYCKAFAVPEHVLFAGRAGGLGRRDALVLTAAAGAVAPRRREPVDPELADYFRDQLAGHYRADRHLGPLRLIPTATAQYELLCDLAGAARGALRRRLWSLAAGYAAFLGWLHQDAGNMERSMRWHEVMLERAHRSHDLQLVAFALHNKAMLHADLRDGDGVLDLTQAALEHGDALIPKVRILALQQTAHGVSLSGGDDARDDCARLLDRAEALLDRVDDEYPWGAACRTPRYFEIQRATCLGRLGCSDEALDIWDRVLPEVPQGAARRDVGVFQARRAQAHAQRREPEHAVAIAEEVVQAARETGSARMRRELCTLRDQMRPWAKERPGRQLSDMLSTLGGRL